MNLSLYLLMALPFIWLGGRWLADRLDRRWRQNFDSQHRERVGIGPHGTEGR